MMLQVPIFEIYLSNKASPAHLSTGLWSMNNPCTIVAVSNFNFIKKSDSALERDFLFVSKKCEEIHSIVEKFHDSSLMILKLSLKPFSWLSESLVWLPNQIFYPTPSTTASLSSSRFERELINLESVDFWAVESFWVDITCNRSFLYGAGRPLLMVLALDFPLKICPESLAFSRKAMP